MKLLPLLLLICLDCGAQRDTVYVTDTIKYKDGGYRINLSDGNYRVTFADGGGIGTGAYKELPVILPKKDTPPNSYKSIQYNITWEQSIQLITELRGKKDTSVFIQGDTMKLIRQLLIDYLKQTLLLDSLRKSRAVIFDAEGKLTVVEYRNIWHWVKSRFQQ